jgi:tetratricopeptide (TPR) repeat protein
MLEGAVFRLLLALCLQVASPPAEGGTPGEAYREYLLARLATFEGQVEVAAAHLSRALVLDPASSEIRVALAMVDLRRGNLTRAIERSREATTLDPDDPEAWAMLSRTLALAARGENGMIEEALRAQQEVVRLMPTDSEPRLILVQRLLEMDRLDEAVASHDEAVGLGGDRGRWEPRLIEAFLRASRTTDALARLDLVMERLDDDPRALRNLVRLLRSYGQPGPALRVMAILREADPAHPGDEVVHVSLLLETGQADRAAEAAGMARDVWPEHGPMARIAGRAFQAAGRLEEAAAAYTGALVAEPGDLEARKAVAVLLGRLGRHGESARHYLAGAEIAETRSLGAAAEFRLLAAAALLEEDRPEAALAALEQVPPMAGFRVARERLRALALARSDRRAEAREVLAGLADLPVPRDRLFLAEADIRLALEGPEATATWMEAQVAGRDGAEALVLEAAHFWRRAGQPVRALVLLREARRSTEPSVPVLVELGSVLSDQGRPREAEQVLREALSLQPDHPTALNNLAYLLAEGRKPGREAVDLAERAVAAEPRNPAFLDTLGWALFRVGRTEEAHRILLRAVGDGGGADPVLREHLGDIQATLGHLEQAVTSYRRALRLAPDDPGRLRRKLEDLDRPGEP